MQFTTISKEVDMEFRGYKIVTVMRVSNTLTYSIVYHFWTIMSLREEEEDNFLTTISYYLKFLKT